MKNNYIEKPLDQNTIRELKANISKLHRHWKRPLISKLMIGRLIGIWKSWNWLTKKQLVKVLIAWKNLQKRWKKSNNYQTISYGSEVHILRAGKTWKRYIPANKMWEARMIASEATGLWVAIRKAKRCIGWKWEIEVWLPDSQESLFSTVKTTYTKAGSFTTSESLASDKNPFKTSIKIPNIKASDRIKASDKVEKTLEEKASEAYEDLFGEAKEQQEKPKQEGWEITEKELWFGTWDRKEAYKKALDKEVEEAERATGVKIAISNRQIGQSTSSVLHSEYYEVRVTEEGRARQVGKNTKVEYIDYTLFEKVETFKVTHVPEKGWSREYKGGIFEQFNTFYNSLKELILDQKECIPF